MLLASAGVFAADRYSPLVGTDELLGIKELPVTVLENEAAVPLSVPVSVPPAKGRYGAVHPFPEFA